MNKIKVKQLVLKNFESATSENGSQSSAYDNDLYFVQNTDSIGYLVSTLYRIDVESFDIPWSIATITSSVLSSNFIFLLVDDSIGSNTVECNSNKELNISKIVGYSIFSKIFEIVNLDTIAISPKYQGQKLGKLLLASSIEKLKIQDNSVESIQLEVRESNVKAINLYKSLGFTEDGIRKNYYPLLNTSKRENAILMSKSVI
jgi:ribosomal-protein-alanine N-acetyltransferase